MAPRKGTALVSPAKREMVSSNAEALLSELQLAPHIKVVGAKAVTRPVLRQHDGIPLAVKIISEITESQVFEGQKRSGEAIQKAADICHVVDLSTGEEMTLIANAAFKSALLREYPNGDYVGRYFAFVSQRRPHKDGKMIREYLIKELEVEE